MIASLLAALFLPLLSPHLPSQIEDVHQESYATAAQARTWLSEHASERFIIATDARNQPVRRRDRIPSRWINRSKQQLASFSGSAQPGEFYVFQVSVFNPGKQPVIIQSVQIDGLPEDVQSVCLNQAVNTHSSRAITVAAAKIATLWIGVESEKVQDLAGNLELAIVNGESGTFETASVPIAISVSGDRIPNHGVDEGWRLSRLKWLLPSDIGVSAEPTKRFRPVLVTGRTIHLTSTTLTISQNGLPSQVASREGSKLLESPSKFVLSTEHGALRLEGAPPVFDPPQRDQQTWHAKQHCEQASLSIDGSAEFDGFVHYRVKLTSKTQLRLKDVRLEVPYSREASPYQLGLGYRGGYTPQETDWKWNIAFHQDCVWLGDVPLGAQWRFKGSNYQRPLVNIYYGYRPLNLPDSWGNSGKGGIRVLKPENGTRLLQAYSGPLTMQPGQTLEFNFDVQLTPSRPLDTDQQWSTRFYHPGDSTDVSASAHTLDTAASAGANVLNVHHRKSVNPFINYPFNDFSVPDLTAFVKSAHDRNIRVKLYYTTLELTWQLPEIWALKSFGDSIIEAGPGAGAQTVINPNGPNPLLTEALEDNFIPAWTTELEGKYAGQRDIAVITRPDSAWTDYYLHGLDWLVKNVQIDGTYIDDTALDRASLQRARRILEAGRPAPLIDLHSWNHEDPLAARGSSTSIYMELFPYIDRIWLGEGFDYQNATPDYWLVSMSGLPYGVMSEMLQGGGNVWRGMLFGETCRLGWSGDPRSMWKFWDQFGMGGTKMIGWWDKNCPVKTDSKDVLATVYKKNGKTLLAVANWTRQDKDVHLDIDWKSLGLDGSKVTLKAPPIEGFQGGGSWHATDRIRVAGSKGLLIILE